MSTEPIKWTIILLWYLKTTSTVSTLLVQIEPFKGTFQFPWRRRDYFFAVELLKRGDRTFTEWMWTPIQSVELKKNSFDLNFKNGFINNNAYTRTVDINYEFQSPLRRHTVRALYHLVRFVSANYNCNTYMRANKSIFSFRMTPIACLIWACISTIKSLSAIKGFEGMARLKETIFCC